MPRDTACMVTTAPTNMKELKKSCADTLNKDSATSGTDVNLLTLEIKKQTLTKEAIEKSQSMPMKLVPMIIEKDVQFLTEVIKKAQERRKQTIETGKKEIYRGKTDTSREK